MIPEAQWVYDVAWFLNQIAQPVAILGAVTFWIHRRNSEMEITAEYDA